jgi:hypothetical protein
VDYFLYSWLFFVGFHHDSLDAKLDNLTIKENGAVDPNELTSKLENLDINCEKDRANNICSDKLEKHNSEDENTSKQGELSKQLDDENLLINAVIFYMESKTVLFSPLEIKGVLNGNIET